MDLETSRGLVDAAVIAHRECPCETHKMAVMSEMNRHHDLFLAEQIIDFQIRTH